MGDPLLSWGPPCRVAIGRFARRQDALAKLPDSLTQNNAKASETKSTLLAQQRTLEREEVERHACKEPP